MPFGLPVLPDVNKQKKLLLLEKFIIFFAFKF